MSDTPLRDRPPSTPSEQGVDAAGLLAFLDAAAEQGRDLHALTLARHGRVVARGVWAPYSRDGLNLVYSLSKSLTSSAVGLLVDRGDLDLDAPVCPLLPGVDPAALHPHYRDLTLRHCLSMATGHTRDAWGDSEVAAARKPGNGDLDPVVAAILADPPEQPPGTVFAYNQVATYLAGAAVRTVTGRSLRDVVGHELLQPLIGRDELRWHVTSRGAELGFSGAHVGIDTVLALAQLYLDEGRVGARQLLSAPWVRTARTSAGLRQSEPNPDWRRGYGLSFWGSRHGYRGDGAFGQFAIVLPEYDAALAILAEDDDMQGTLDLVWEHLIPAFDRRGDSAADRELARRLESAAIPALPGDRSAGTWARDPADTRHPDALPAGWHGVELRAEGLVLRHATGDLSVRVPLSSDRWAHGEISRDGWVLPTAASGGRTEAGLIADIRLVRTPHTIQVRPAGQGAVSLRWRRVPLTGPDPAALLTRP